MERHIKTIWGVFKHYKTEAFYLFDVTDGACESYKISKNETENSGEIDVKQIMAHIDELAGRQVIAVHNHPNGLPTPSFPDLFQKHYVEALLALCNIHMVDYGVVSPYGYVSLLDNGVMVKKQTHTLYESEEVYPSTLPSVFLNKDIVKVEAQFIEALQQTPEILLNNKEQFASRCFPGNFLLAKRDDFVSKNILFYGNDITENKERLRQLDLVLEPFEIYGIIHNRLVPLKLNGFL